MTKHDQPPLPQSVLDRARVRVLEDDLREKDRIISALRSALIEELNNLSWAESEDTPESYIDALIQEAAMQERSFGTYPSGLRQPNPDPAVQSLVSAAHDALDYHETCIDPDCTCPDCNLSRALLPFAAQAEDTRPFGTEAGE